MSLLARASAGVITACIACPNVSIEHYDVFTNAGPCAAFRGPGQTQGIFALEQAIDAVATSLNIDPVAMREQDRYA